MRQPDTYETTRKEVNTVSATTAPKMLPLKRINAVYGLPYSTVRQYIREGRLKAYRVGTQVYVKVEDLEALFVPTHSD
jgi:excisionase family DNA binding protein